MAIPTCNCPECLAYFKREDAHKQEEARKKYADMSVSQQKQQQYTGTGAGFAEPLTYTAREYETLTKKYTAQQEEMARLRAGNSLLQSKLDNSEVARGEEEGILAGLQRRLEQSYDRYDSLLEILHMVGMKQIEDDAFEGSVR